VTSIGQSPFYNCNALGKITILAKNAPSIENSSLSGINYTNGKLFVPEGSTGYEKWMSVLGGKSWLCLHENYILQNGIYYSADGKILLGTDKSIAGTLLINNNIEYIYPFAFRDCVNLKSLTIPNLITSIEGGTFWECTGLTEITIPNSVTNIGGSAFYGCTGLTEITIPNLVTSIGAQAFYKCSGLTEVTIPELVTSIGNSAFYQCSGLKSITSLATTAPNIGSYTFYGVESFGTLIVPSSCTDAYATWMSKSTYYLGYRSWTIQEMTE
jgi:hypothetical protein